MKIGILTWLYNGNYGSILQAYALQKYLRDLENDITNINYNPTKKERVLNLIKCKNSLSLFWEKWDLFLAKRHSGDVEALKRKDKKFKYFREHFFCLSEVYRKSVKLKSIIGKYDLYICGSDQIWSPMLLNPIYFFSFLPDSCKKISYACSFGMSFIPQDKKDMFIKLLKRFDAISVREEKGAEIVQKLTGIVAPVLADPTLLLSKDEWNKIAIKPEYTEPYIFCYFLSYNNHYIDKLEKIKKKYNIKVIIISTSKKIYKFSDDIIYDAGPREWVGLIKYADVIITDSYHGCIFSILYKKKFYVLKRFDDLNPKSQNSRIYTLLKKYNLSQCMINDLDDIDKNYSLDYKYICELVEEDILNSKSWLQEQIETNKKVKETTFKTAYDSIGKSECRGCGCCSLVCPFSCIEMCESTDGFIYPKIDYKNCVECGICKEKCPVIKTVLNSNKDIYAAVLNNKKKLMLATSGGVFGVLAENTIIVKKGIVYGAIYDENLNVYHGRADSLKALKDMYGSKYVQSSSFLTFEKVRDDLNNQKYVLFSGTGCQIAALRNYLDKSYKNLLCVEVVCHGVPAPGLFRKYISWLSESNGGKITKYKFRTKELHPMGEHYKITVRIGDINKYIFSYKDPFYSSFLSGRIVRDSCHSCHFKGKDRTGDITIGDFWGIEKIVKHFPVDNGVSVVLLNNDKALETFEEIKNKFYIAKTGYKEACAYNSAIDTSVIYVGDKYDLNSSSLFSKDLVADFNLKLLIKNHIPWRLKVALKRFI